MSKLKRYYKKATLAFGRCITNNTGCLIASDTQHIHFEINRDHISDILSAHIENTTEILAKMAAFSHCLKTPL